MTKKIICTLSMFLLSVLCFAEELPKSGQFEVTHSNFIKTQNLFGDVLLNFPTKYFPCEPKVTVFLPGNYTTSEERYRVIYLTEDERIFKANLKEIRFKSRLFRAVNSLYSEDKIEKVIIVDISFPYDKCNMEEGENNVPDEQIPAEKSTPIPQKSLKELFAKFLSFELVPYIDVNYRVVNDASGRIIVDRSLDMVSRLSTTFDKAMVL
ncbi:MAG TPA: alpha/beta hydrolase-fold protein, partial [Elusimicrobiales bacterium]|nr:alpha/beta hydrolase-fold protein [Elusimicrobiales bacterium]